MVIRPYIMFVILLLLVSCQERIPLIIETENEVVINATLTQKAFLAVINEYDMIRCGLNCDQRFDTTSFVQVESPSFSIIPKAGDLGLTLGYSKILDTASFIGATNIMTVVKNGRSFTARDVRPRDEVVVKRINYDNLNKTGLALILDPALMDSIQYAYVQLSRQGAPLLPFFGFLLSNESNDLIDIGNNGRFLNDSTYFIEENLINLSGVETVQDTMIIVFHNITEASFQFYTGYKETVNRYIQDIQLGQQNNLLFAPGNNIPSNFTSNAKGFFHVVQEYNYGIVID